MTLLALLLVILVVGVVAYLFEIPAPYNKLLYAVLVIAIIFWLLGALGVIPNLRLN